VVLSESLLLGSERRLSFSAHSSPCEDAHRRDALIRQIAPRIWPLEKSHDFAYVIHWQNGAKVKIQSRRQHVAHWRLRDHLPHLCPLHRSIVCPYSLAFPAAPRASLTRGPELSLLPGGAPRFSRPHQHLSHPRPHPTLQSSRVFLPRGVALLVFRGDVSHATDSFFFFLSLSLPNEFPTSSSPPDPLFAFSPLRPTSSRPRFLHTRRPIVWKISIFWQTCVLGIARP